MKRLLRSSASIFLAGLSLLLASLPAWAECNLDDVMSSKWRFDGMLKFYDIHARPILGREQRLPNGTAWRVVTDSVTGTSEPRLTWMADKATLVHANRLLTARHACSILTYFGKAAELFDNAVETDTAFTPGYYFDQPPEKVALSYATPRLLSGFSVTVVSFPYLARAENDPAGWVFDFAANRFVRQELCDPSPLLEPDQWGIKLGDFLEVCSDADRAAFEALWERHVGRARALAEARGWPLCDPDKENDKPRNRHHHVHLAQAGLAVYTGYIWPRILRTCMTQPSADNPVIIPWAELEPFLHPGPWRDELLPAKK